MQYAILETSGRLSVFQYPKYMPANASDAGVKAKAQYLPVSIIEDGYLFTENLRYAGKDLNWVRRVLQERSATISGTWLLTVDREDHIMWLQKEAQKQ